MGARATSLVNCNRRVKVVLLKVSSNASTTRAFQADCSATASEKDLVGSVKVKGGLRPT